MKNLKVLFFASLMIVSTFSQAASKAEECGTLAGLIACTNTANFDNEGYGDIDYWIRSTKLRCRAARNAQASVHEIISEYTKKAQQNKFYLNFLLDLEKSLDHVSSEGYGDLDYWSSRSGTEARKTKDIHSRTVEFYKTYCEK